MSFNVAINFSWFTQTSQTPLDTGSVSENGNFTVKIYPSWYKQVAVEWSVPVEFGNCIFDVYFSQTEDGPYQKLNSTPISGTFLVDTTTQEYSKFHNGWYIVEAILVDKGSVRLRSSPKTWKTYQRDWVTIRSNEIQRREYWLLSKFAGIKSYLFRKKNYGKRCTKCWDPRTEQILDDHCPVCLGTSFDGGFFEPAPIFIQYESTPNDRQFEYFGRLEQNQIGAWTISIPEFTPEDIVVRTGDWNMYSVDKITPTELQGNTVRQMMVLTQLSKNSVEYQLVKRNLPEFPQQFTANNYVL